MKAKYSSALTLIELLIAVAVASIVLVLGVPSFSTMTLNNRMSSRINEMVAEINLARSEAVKRGNPVVMCARNVAGNACSNVSNWLLGWIIFSDVNGNGVVDAASDTLVRVHGPMTGLTSIHFTNNSITFNASGYAAGVNNVTITFCDSRGISQAKGLVLAKTGRLRKAVSTDRMACP